MALLTLDLYLPGFHESGPMFPENEPGLSAEVNQIRVNLVGNVNKILIICTTSEHFSKMEWVLTSIIIAHKTSIAEYRSVK